MDLLDLLAPSPGDATYEGFLKVKLLHAQGFSILMPDLLVVDFNGPKWFQAKYFSACLLGFHEDTAYAQFSFELNEETRLFVRFTNDRVVAQLADGSSLYRCRITGPHDLDQRASGECVVEAGCRIALWLHHHTEPDVVDMIRGSGHFRGSPWNIQGTKKLANVEYAYFTSLPRIVSDEDLIRIAMASNGSLALMPTNGKLIRDVVPIKVYRESTFRRRATLRMLIAAELLAPQHVYRHAPHGEPVYYEVCHPEIFRVGLLPGKTLPFKDERIQPVDADLKRFEYAVLGDADTAIGLAAPYDEEHTPAIFKIQHLSERDIFEFWRQHANTDKFSGYAVERQAFQNDPGVP